MSRLRPADAGELAAAAAQFGEVVDEAEASQEVLHKANSLQGLAFALAYQGELSAARAAADAALEAAELGEYFAGMGYSALTTAALAAGDVQTAQHASEAAWRNLSLALPLSQRCSARSMPRLHWLVVTLAQRVVGVTMPCSQ